MLNKNNKLTYPNHIQRIVSIKQKEAQKKERQIQKKRRKYLFTPCYNSTSTNTCKLRDDSRRATNTLICFLSALTPPNPKCYVCAPKPEVGLACNLKQLTLKDLTSAFKEGLNMQAPDATVEGKGLVVLSSEPGETDHNNDKTLEEIGLNDGCALLVDDFLQNYEVRVRLQQEDEEKSWRLVTDTDAPMPAPKEDEKPANGSNGSEPKPGPSTSRAREDSDSDMEIIEEDEDEPTVKPPKRRRTEMSDEIVNLC